MFHRINLPTTKLFRLFIYYTVSFLVVGGLFFTSPAPAALAACSKDVNFGNAIGFGAGNFTRDLVVADFNGDGKLDNAATIYDNVSLYGNTNEVDIALGNGDGTFRTAIRYNTSEKPQSLVAGDFNGDNKLDIVTSNKDGTTINFFVGNGNGTLQPYVEISLVGTGYYASGLVAADINRDGKLDILAGSSYPNPRSRISVLLGNGNGTFRLANRFDLAVDYLGSSALADLNADGKLDLITSGGNNNYSYYVLVLLGNGDGSFQPPITNDADSISGDIAITDINGDGKLDIVTGYVTILFGYGNGYFQPPFNYSVVGGLSFGGDVQVADFNNDGNQDVIVFGVASTIGSSYQFYRTLLGTGYGSFQEVRGLVSSFSKTAVADLNQDNKPDLLVDFSTAKLNTTPATSSTVSYLEVIASGNALTSRPLTVTIAAKGSCGNIIPAYTGTIRFTSDIAGDVLPPDYTFTTGDAGTHTFNLTFATSGTHTINIADSLNSLSNYLTVKVSPPGGVVNYLPNPIRVASTINFSSGLISSGLKPTPYTFNTQKIFVSPSAVPNNAIAVMGVLTNVRCTGGANLRIWTGSSVPDSINLNIPGANSALNLSTNFITALDYTGDFNLGIGSGQLVKCGYAVDITGYITPAPSDTGISLLSSPVRVAATIGNNPNPKLIANAPTPSAPPSSSSVAIQVSGTNNIPANATGIMGVLTNVGCTGGGNLRFWAGNSVPNTVNLNIPGANAALNLSTGFTAPLDASGKVNLGLGSGANIQCGYAVDVVGYVTTPAPTESVTLLPASVRIANTLDNSRPKLAANGVNPSNPPNSNSVSIQAGGVNGIPANAKGVIGVLTNANCSGGGNLRFWAGTAIPDTINLNVPGANFALNLSTGFSAPLDANGKINLGLGSGVPISCGYAVDVIAYTT